MKLNNGVRFDDSFLATYGLDGFLHMPMSNEKIQLPKDVDDAVSDVINKFKGIGKTDARPIKNLIKVLAENDALLSEHIPADHISKNALENLDKLFSQHNAPDA